MASPEQFYGHMLPQNVAPFRLAPTVKILTMVLPLRGRRYMQIASTLPNLWSTWPDEA